MRNHHRRRPPPRRPTLHVASMDLAAFEKARNTLSLAVTMQSGLDSKICDRRWRNLKVYKQCFLHADAVDWMKQHLFDKGGEEKDAPTTNEIEAVKKLNEMLDAGYVSHVCNDHRFKVGEKAVLYFHFHKDVMESDMKSFQKGHRERGIEDLLLQDQDAATAALKLAVDRLTSTVEKYSEQLDEAHGKILVLEEAVASLGFACAVVLFIGATATLYHILSEVLQSRVAILVYVAIATVLVVVSHREGSISLLSMAEQHLSVLVKLMHPSIEYEDAFMEDIETQEQESLLDNGAPARDKPGRGSVLLQMNQALSSFRKIGSQRMVPSGAVAGIRMREAWDLPDQDTWPHRPALLVVNTPVSPLLVVPKHGSGPCPLGIPFDFSSELFEGKCLVRLRDTPSDDPAADEEYFLGRRRRFQAIVQGRFKEELAVSDVLTGHEFVRSLQRLPPSWMLRAGTNLIRRLAPGAQIELRGENPCALAILAATSQAVSADMPGNEPDITDANIPEDASLLGGMFAEGNTPASTRKRILSSPDRAKQYTFDTESVYTFDFYQQLLDVATYSLHLGFTKLGVSKNLDGQPIQVMSKTLDGRYLWSFQLWHENLLQGGGKSE